MCSEPWTLSAWRFGNYYWSISTAMEYLNNLFATWRDEHNVFVLMRIPWWNSPFSDSDGRLTLSRIDDLCSMCERPYSVATYWFYHSVEGGGAQQSKYAGIAAPFPRKCMTGPGPCIVDETSSQSHPLGQFELWIY